MPGDKQSSDFLRDKTNESEVLPAYEAIEASQSAHTRPTTDTSEPRSGASGPTISCPFEFPVDVPAPAYTQSSKPSQRPIAIPQISPDPTAPFLHAYAPSLLAQGIPPESWTSFLDTLSAFLAATVADQAIKHAGDVAKQLGDVPMRFGKNITNHAKEVGRNISKNAKNGSIVGAAFGIIGGAISLPIATAVGAVGAILSLPGTTANAVAQKPQTPRERATLYTTVTNDKWLGPRHLHAKLMDTQELAGILGLTSAQILEATRAGKNADADTQLRSLRTHLAELQLESTSKLKVGEKTIWLVIMQISES